VLADGGESCIDVEHLRIGGSLFGSVPSDYTVARTFHEIGPGRRDGIAGAVATVPRRVWRRSSATNGLGPVLLDIDGSLVDIHSENEERAEPTHKGGFGFHPMFCFADQTGETLAGLLHPGRAGANTVADHVMVLDAALGQLPGAIATRPLDGDDPGRSSPLTRRWCGPIRPAAPRGSLPSVGPETSASSSRLA